MDLALKSVSKRFGRRYARCVLFVPELVWEQIRDARRSKANSQSGARCVDPGAGSASAERCNVRLQRPFERRGHEKKIDDCVVALLPLFRGRADGRLRLGLRRSPLPLLP